MKRNYENSVATKRFYELVKNPSKFPISFKYGGVLYEGFSPKNFKFKSESTDNLSGKETKTFVFDLNGELSVTLTASHYVWYGATEWTVWFENVSDKNTGVIEDVKTTLSFCGKYPVLKGILGDHVNQYSPYSVDLKNQIVEFSSDSGRATHINFPYFNLECGDGGVMLAIGWGGTWQAKFSSDGEVTTYIASSVNGLKTYLKPNEKIRTALFLVAPYLERDENYATNFWRSFYMKHVAPSNDKSGAPIKPFSTCFLAYDTGLTNSDGSISENYKTWRPSFEKMLSENIKLTFRWLDAGWYVAPDGTSAEPYNPEHDWWDTVGTWEPDPAKWPGGSLRESTDFAREHEMKTLMWFEPERVTDPDNLVKNYGYDPSWAIRVEGERAISNDIGNPDCLRWTTERICKVLRENGIEMYREDNNCNASSLWKHLDGREGEKRQGITECKLIAAHYKMWDDIIECTSSFDGGCAFVDSCASGGGRNDLESMRRGLPLLRSDSDRKSVALRLSMTTSFNKWIPFCGANTKEKLSELAPEGNSDPYVWRASYLPSLNVEARFVHGDKKEFDSLRFGLSEWERVAPYLLKEFYVLTPWHKEQDVSGFTAYSFFDHEIEEGALLAFRQESCVRDTLTVNLPFVDKGDTYELTDEDSGETLLTNGAVTLMFASPRSARLVWIKRRK